MTRVRIPELAGRGRLGRHVNHDPRSLAYRTAPASPAPVDWPRHIPILDQGNLGSCTGNAEVGALGTGPLWDALEAVLSAKGATLMLDEGLAMSIYSDAEKVDGGAGLPSEDQGSSGLSVAKVAKTRGYVSGYRHAASVAEAHGALQAGPIMLGTDWLTGFDSPRPDGTVADTSGQSRGGHEYLCRGYDPTRDLWWMDNSWGTGYGLAGRFAYDTPTLEKLLGNGGDVTALAPLNSPAPTPTPGPLPRPGVTRTWTSPLDTGDLEAWAARPHSWHLATQAAAAWKRGT